MKTTKIFLLYLIIALPLFSQTKVPNKVKVYPYKVNGHIVENKSGKDVPYVTVTLVNDSTKEKRSVACDGSGKFQVDVSKPDKYTMILSAVGYKELKKKINVLELKTDVGKIEMEDGINLKEVTVTAQKPLVRVEVDKIVYSMDADPEAQTSNSLEMLRKVPLITVDAEENISVNGQNNFKVLINGKSSSMISKNLKDVLKSMPAYTIKDIEVITNPSSKYDAEGVGGIVNIITVKKTFSGYNGSVSSGFDSRGSLNGSVYLATKIKKFSFSTRVFGNQFKQPDSKSVGDGEYFNNSTYRNLDFWGESTYKGTSFSFSGEASYEIDTLNLISLSFWGYNASYDSDNSSFTNYSNLNDIVTRGYRSNTIGDTRYGSVSGNIDYQKTFKKPDKSLTFSYKLESDPRRTNNRSEVDSIINYSSYDQRSLNDAAGREHTAQIDYYDPLTKMHQVESGVKFILRENTSNSEVYRNGILLPRRTNDLDYDQYIFGAYAGYVFKWKKFSTRTGLRLEKTWNDGTSKSDTVTNFSNELYNLVPYITLSFMPKAGRTIKLSYTQRLSRPSIYYLNPYVNDADSMNISYGNPSLKSEIAHSFEFGYSMFTKKFNISLSTSGSFVNNSIERITSVLPNGATSSTYKNIGRNETYGLNTYVSYRPSQKINVYLNGGVNYSKVSAFNGYSIHNEGFNFRGSLGVRVTTWKQGSISINANASTPRVMAQSKYSVYYSTSIGVSQYLLKRKLSLSVYSSDPFWARKTNTYEFKDPNFIRKSESSRLARNVRFSIMYTFGKVNFEVKKAKRGIKNDDLKGGESSTQSSSQD